ncbi:MAG: hypothetical protein DHS20C15_13840 [Planctomycetota bacterium]|nr:MAG: hypothetical protein DHS20C15_13840 [Planctomycetota bacterium]
MWRLTLLMFMSASLFALDDTPARAAPHEALIEWSTDDGPQAREHPALIHDGERNRVILFGGSGYAPQLAPLSDVWAFDLDTHAWSRVDAHGELPTGGGSRRVAQTPGAQHALLFGGYDGSMQPNAELHRVELRDDGVHFARVEQHDAPPARFLHGFGWDATRERGVLFGGVSNRMFDDTWLLELRDGAAHWTQLVTERAPSPRYGFAFALDASSGRFVVAGGADQRFPAEVPSDTWALDLNAEPPAWAPLEQATLAFGRNPCQAFAWADGTLVLHGGTANGRDVVPGVHALDLRTDAPTWRALDMPDDVPPRASGAGFASSDGHAVWLGFGNSGAGAFRDLFRVTLNDARDLAEKARASPSSSGTREHDAAPSAAER